MNITLDQLKQITNQKESILNTFINPLNKIFVQNVSYSNLIISHFLAQISHESGCFRYTSEIASGEAYEGRTDLGNTQPGFGKKYKGSGLIQVTGFYNYQKLTNYFGVDFINNPQLLQTPEWATKSADWFFKVNKLYDLASQNDFLGITLKINGGFTNLKDRLKYLKLCFKTFQVPNSEVLIKDILSKIDQNLLLPSTNYYKTALRKAVPDQQTSTQLKNYINSI